MANTPAKGKPGRNTSVQGGNLTQYRANRRYSGGGITLSEASKLSFSNQGQKSLARANYHLALLERRRRLDAERAKKYGRKSGFLSPGCHPEAAKSGDIYQFSKENLPTSVSQSAFLCKIPPYREKKYTSQLNELRIFVEGAEISTYVRGGVSWGYQSTSGMNSFQCTLNNDADAFIITPQNVCANLNLSGWRVPSVKGKRLIDYPGRESARFDEVAKYKIYAKKYRAVNPTGKGKANIDANGMWLYPLNPYSVIFNKHDPIRAFTRMPHVTGVGRKIAGKREGWQLWMPVFTGFLRSISWHDDPVGGDRTVSLDAYDYKGLMNRMRVKTAGFRQPGGGGILGNRDTANDTAIYGNKKGVNFANSVGAYAWGGIMQLYGLHKPLNDLYDSVLRLQLTKCAQPPQADCIAASRATAKKATAKYVPKAQAAHNKGQPALEFIKKFTGVNYDIGPKTKGNPGPITFYPVSTKKKTPKKDGKGGSTQQGGSVLKGMIQLITTVKKTSIDNEGLGIGFIEGAFSKNAWEGGLPTTSSTKKTKKGMADLGKVLSQLAGEKKVTDSRYAAIYVYANALTKGITTMFQSNPNKKLKGAQEALGRINKILVDGGKGALTTDSNSASKIAYGTLINKESWNDLVTWQNDVAAAIHSVQNDLKKEVKTAKDTAKKAAKALEKVRQDLVKEIKATADSQAAARRTAKAGAERRAENIIAKTKKARAEGAARQPRTKEADSIAAVYTKYVDYERGDVGIYSDLSETVASSSGGTPHPLANMSYEQASEFLICKKTNMKAGVRLDVGRYKDGVMEGYNRQAVFGIIGRPYTYQEVTTIGKLTTSDYNKDVFAPVNGFYHLVTPASGTGAATIVQADVSANQKASKTIQYATRLSLMQQISELIDFQWYISPMGDNCVEMPNYNILPVDFGKTFAGAYRVQLEWQGGDINEEATDLPTGWVFQGNESQALGQGVFDRNTIAQNEFQKIPILAPLLARRLGVQVEHVAIDLPGVGGTLSSISPSVALDAVRIWGLVYIQRQLGAAHTLSASMPFRPYLLPNRPVHVVPRQRIGLLDTVDFTCEPPNGAFNVSFSTKYVRWLFRDGTFRTMAGGYRQPVDFTGFFSGVQSFRMKEGVQTNQSAPNARTYNTNKGVPTTNPSAGSYVKMPRSYGAINCDPALKGAFLDAASSYGDDLSSQFGSGYLSAASQADSGIIAGARIHRSASSKARSEPGDAVTTDGTGLKENQKSSKKKTSGARYDLSKLFFNPYPFGLGTRKGYGPDGKKGTLRFNNWLLRVFDKGYLSGYQSGAKGGNYAIHKAKFTRHNGIDILAKKGTDLLAPVNAWGVSAKLTVGPFEEGSNRAPIKYVTVKGVQAANSLWPVMVYKNGKYNYKAAGPLNLVGSVDMTTYSVPVYAKQYDAWIASKRKLPVTRKKKGGARGLAIGMYCRVLPPKLNNDPQLSRAVQASKTPKGLLAYVSIKHCADIQKKQSGAFIRKAQKGDVIGKVGDTGTRAAHAHVDMWIHNPVKSAKDRKAGRQYPKSYYSSGDRALFAAAAKANREYLETLLLLKVTGGDPTSGKLSPEWQKYFKSRGTAVSSVREAVAVLWKSNKWFEAKSDPFARKILTNAFFYFKPSDVVRGASEYDSVYNVWYSTAPLESQGNSKENKSFCGKLPSAEARNLFVKLQTCLLKAGKSGTSLNKTRRRRCRVKYNAKQLDILRQTEAIKSSNSQMASRLDAAVERDTNNDTNRRIPIKSKRIRYT